MGEFDALFDDSAHLLVSLDSFIELGKAGQHFRLGACISYHGKEREVSHFSFVDAAFSFDSNVMSRLTSMRCLLRLIYPPAGCTNRYLPSARLPIPA